MNNFAVINIFFVDVECVKRFGQGYAVPGNGNVVIFALGVLFQRGEDALTHLTFAFAVFKADIFILSFAAAPFAVKFAEFFERLRVMHSFGHTDIYLGEAFIVLQGNFNDFRYNITRLLGTAQRAGNDDFDVFVFEVVGGGVSLVNTAVGQDGVVGVSLNFAFDVI